MRGTTKVTDEARVTIYEYDEQHQLLKVYQPNQVEGQATPLPANSTYAKKAGAEPVVTNAYNSRGQLSQQIIGGDAVSDTDAYVYTFDNSERASGKVSVIDGSNWESIYELNENGNARQMSRLNDDASSEVDYFVTKFEYNDDMEITKVTHPEGNGSEFEYDETAYDAENQQESGWTKLKRGNLLESTRHDDMASPTVSLTTEYTYDDTDVWWQPTKIRPPKGVAAGNEDDYDTDITYDAYGNKLTETRYLSGHTVSITNTYVYYGAAQGHQLDTHEDPEGRVTKYRYEDIGTPVDNNKGYLWKIIVDNSGLQLTMENTVIDNIGRATTVRDPRAVDTVYDFNDVGEAWTVTNANNHSDEKYDVLAEYDANGNKVSTTLKYRTLTATPGSYSEVETTFEYDIHNRLTKQVEDAGTGTIEATTTKAYTISTGTNEVLTSVLVDPVPATDVEHRVKEVFNSRGLVKQKLMGYDATAGTLSTETYEYDDNKNLIKRTDGNAKVWTSTYDGFDRLDTSTDPVGYYMVNTYDAHDKLTDVETYVDSTKATKTGWVQTVYDDQNRPTSIRTGTVAAEQSTIATTYYKDGLVKKITDAESNITSTALYDGAGRKQYEIFGDYTGTDPTNPLDKPTDGLNWVHYVYDANGNNTIVHAKEWEDTAIMNYTTTNTFNVLNLLTKVKDPNNQDTDFIVDTRGNTTKTTDANSNVTDFTYDALGRMTKKEEDPSEIDAETAWVYYPNGLLKQMTDAESNVTKYFDDTDPDNAPGYDRMDRSTLVEYADSGSESFTYDAINMTMHTKLDGTEIDYTYDAINRLTLVEEGASNDDREAYTYTYITTAGPTLGHLKVAATGTLVVDSVTYTTTVTTRTDTRGYRVEEKQELTDSVAGAHPARTVTLTPNKTGALTKILHPSSNRDIDITRDSLQRVQDIKESTNYIADYEYKGVNRLWKRWLGAQVDSTPANGISKLTITYEPSTFAVQKWENDRYEAAAWKSDVPSYQYTLDNIYSRTTAKRIETNGAPTNPYDNYQYDNMYRIKGAQYQDNDGTYGGNTFWQKHEFNLDEVGNRDGATGMLIYTAPSTYTDKTYTPNAVNEYDTAHGVINQQHDANGNYTGVSGGLDNGWDYKNRLTHWGKETNGDDIRYVYDHTSRLVLRRWTDGANDKATRYIWNGWQCIEEYSVSYGPIAETLEYSYVYNPDNLDERLQMEKHTSTTATYWYVTDVQGNVVALIDKSDGSMPQTYTYDLYGNLINYTYSVTNYYGYQGRRIDPTTGKYYYRNRWYDPVPGRFLSRDPKGYEDGPNLYAFVNNNPINYVDPMGLSEEERRYAELLRDEEETTYEEVPFSSPLFGDGTVTMIKSKLTADGELLDQFIHADKKADELHNSDEPQANANVIKGEDKSQWEWHNERVRLRATLERNGVLMAQDQESAGGGKYGTANKLEKSNYLKALYSAQDWRLQIMGQAVGPAIIPASEEAKQYLRDLDNARGFASTASRKAKELYPNQDPGSGKRNAFIHTYWSYLIAAESGGAFAKEVTDRHERLKGESRVSQASDQFNNYKGRKFATTISSDDIVKHIQNEIKAGNLSVTNHK